jgi:hypothetical protein
MGTSPDRPTPVFGTRRDTLRFSPPEAEGQRDLRREDLDLRDPVGRSACVALVHHPSRLEAKETGHFDFHAGIGDDVVIGAKLGELLPESLALQ